ncbi:hypothetical protein RSOLAG1IB_00008 [Rhizoctonia solani AG-1 IB]|uniref:Uncharacterized protein n=1 Tax=Thanatephorus cucumeris (strain AG1-IB / isolate 7/3/14) TaxID=1108050 RepID=A0A0B7F5K8_THACB|nr:hypothetical protein RSOLAG1IB_00008 [Rhizoctonia solani AG-1 IB]
MEVYVGNEARRDHVPVFFLEYISILRENRSYMRTRQTDRETQKEPCTVTTNITPHHTPGNGKEKKKGVKTPSEINRAKRAQREEGRDCLTGMFGLDYRWEERRELIVKSDSRVVLTTS